MGTPTMMAGMTAGESISFSKVASIYDATRGGSERGDRFAAAIVPWCGQGPVVEVGVGTGIVARPLEAESGRPVVGFDLAPEMLVYAHDRIGARVGVADVAALPVRERLEPLAAECGLRIEVETTTGPGTWEESPADLIERMEQRQWGVLIDLDQDRFDTVVQPVIDGLRALPEPGRKRVRIARHRLFVLAPA
jgi:hypothetical protein